MMYLTFFCTIFLFLYLFLFSIVDRKNRVKSRVEQIMNQQTIQIDPAEEPRVSLYNRTLVPLWKAARRNFRIHMPTEKANKIELKLLRAGSPFNMGPTDFRLAQIACLLLMPILLGFYSFVLGLRGGVLLSFVGIGLFFGAIVPNFYLNTKIKKRQKSALHDLPDFVDLLTVSLEAGLGFDSALSKVISRQSGVLASEFHRFLEEVRLGRTRRESLVSVKNRLELAEVTALLNSILQAEKLGVGMVQVLRIQSDDIREKRRQRAEEQAMKAPIKILFPLVFFIFPSLFIVILGPAVIEVMKAF